MAEEGRLCSQDIENERKPKAHAWDSTTLAKSTLQKLYFHGRILISRREGKLDLVSQKNTSSAHVNAAVGSLADFLGLKSEIR